MKALQKSAKKRKGRRRQILRGICIGGLLLLTVFTVALGIWIQVSLQTELPESLLLPGTDGTPPTMVFYRFSDRTNRTGSAEVLTEGVPQRRAGGYVPYSELPQDLIHAVVAIEDKRFYQHRGVDWRRTAAAGVSYLTGGSRCFGGSTVTQQTVKNLTGDRTFSLRRKLQELLYARDMERLLDKSEIMELYLNIIPFANGCTGIGQAAAFYYQKSPSELTPAECATIVGITNQPSFYDPLKHPENALARRDLILSEMLAQGYLDGQEYANAVASSLGVVAAEAATEGTVHSWYVDMVLEDVIGDLVEQTGMSRAAASARVLGGGLRIEMAMDAEIQAQVTEYYCSQVRMPCNPNGVSAQSALIVIDAKTGDILAVAGAVGEKRADRIQNLATQALRPPGSAIKPLSVYAPALEEGRITWASVYDDVPLRVEADTGVVWPKNASNCYRGLTTVSYAVAHSTNTVALRVLEELGLRNSYRWAKERFHLESMIDRWGESDCDLAALGLGQLNYGVTLRELTAAYTAFADAGTVHPYRSYYRVLDADGTVLLSCPDEGEQVLSAENAAVMTKLLQGVVQSGTSSAITLARRVECAGKTGTTQNDYDRWFVGFTPDTVCGVWCGYEYPEPLEGRSICTGIWNDVMSRIFAQKGGRTEFDIPANVVRLTYCQDSGKLMGEQCLSDPRGSRMASGWFVLGTEPTACCDRHVLCAVAGEDGGVLHDVDAQFREDVRWASLIRVERSFPLQVTVADAQYVARDDPALLTADPDPTRAYFEQSLPEPCGRSGVRLPFNRSHTPKRIEQAEPPDS